MRHEVIGTRQSESDLNGIVAHWLKKDPDYAALIHDQLLNYVAGLADNPFVGDVTRRTRRGEYRLTRFQSYKVIFRVVERERKVYVMRFRHVRRRTRDSLE